MSSTELVTMNDIRLKAVELEKKINAVDCTNILSTLKTGTKISISATDDGCSLETFEGVFVHYSRPTSLITVLMDNGSVTIYNLNKIFCLSFSVDELESVGG